MMNVNTPDEICFGHFLGYPVTNSGFVCASRGRCEMQTVSGKFWARPATRLGWWAVRLAAAGIVLILAWSILPGGALLGFLCGLVGGLIALIAMIRQQERSWLVFLSILPMLWVIAFILGEFLVPH